MTSIVSATARMILLMFAIMWSIPSTALAQWDPYPWKNMPRTADGKVDMNAPPRRTADGKVDLSGFWMPADNVRHLLNLAADLKPEEVPLQPWAGALYKERIENNGKDHPGVRCLPSGIPEKNNIPDGLKVVQTPDVLIFLYESRTIYRQVFTDGRPLPNDPTPSWQGYSSAKWEGDTLVINSIGFRDDLWIDWNGSMITSSAKVQERIRRPDYGHLEVQAMVDDPKAYTKPWTVTLRMRIALNTELVDEICLENEKSSQRMK